MTDFDVQNNTSLLTEKEGTFRVLNQELKLHQKYDWCYSDPSYPYSFEISMIEGSILYFKQSGEMNTKALSKAKAVLQPIAVTPSSKQPLHIIYDLTQLHCPDNALIRTKLHEFISHFNQYFQTIYFLLPPVDPSKFWIPLDQNAIPITSLAEALEDCLHIKEADSEGNFLTQDPEKLHRKELINVVKQLQEANQLLKAEKLTENEKKYRSVVDSIREVIFQTDTHGKLSFLSLAWKEVSGNNIHDSLGQSIINFIHPDDRSNVSRLFEDIIQGKKDEVKCEARFTNNRYNIFWAEIFVKAYLDDSGKIIGTSGTLDDITKQKHAEATLRQSKQLLESVSKNIKEAIIRIDYKAGLVYFNQAFKEMFGYESDNEVQEMPVNLLFANQRDLKVYTHILREQKFLTNKIILFKRKDGSTFWGLSSFTLIQEENGNEIYDGAIRDITDRQEAEKNLKEKNQELRKTNEELDRFVYSASHDLRAPLASTLGLINISRISPEEKERIYYLDLMEQSLNRMDKIIQDLTDYSRNARLEIETEEIDFDGLVKDVLQRLKYLKTVDDVTINTKIEAKDTFYSDKIRLYVIMINLLSNSIKYHKYDQPHPFINVSIAIDAKEAVIQITDNGIGIEKSYLDKIFTMFFQVSRDSFGSGLGLYIAKETINKLNGNISVKSVVNKGSTFTVILPNVKPCGCEAAGQKENN